jgi:branched-chain amino acid transport system substrate-binding protein
MKKAICKICGISCILILAVLAVACKPKSTSSSGSNIVKVGFLYTLSGVNADAGAQDLAGARLAVKHWNEQGGIKSLGGAKIELVVADSTSDPAQSKNACERLLQDKEIVGIVGCGISAVTLPVLPVTEKAQVAILTICMSPEITGQGYKYVFQTAPLASSFGKTQIAFLDWLNKEKGYNVKKIGIIYENSAWGIGSAEGSRAIAKAADLEIVYDESFPAGFTDASAIITSLKASGAEAVLPTAYTQEAKLLVNTMNSLNYHPIIIGGGGGFVWPAFGEELGNDVNGIVSVGNWNFDSKFGSPNLEKTAAEFESTNGYFMTEHAGPTYVAYDVLFQAIEQAASRDPVTVRDTLAKGRFTNLIQQDGEINFNDETGLNDFAYAIMIQWINGKPTTIFPEKIAANPFTNPTDIK